MIPFRIVPERGQVTEDVSEGRSSVDGNKPGDVLHRDDAGSKTGNDSGERRPEPPLVGLREAATRAGDGLTGEASDDGVDPLEVVGEVPDVAETADVRVSLPEDEVAPVVELDGPGRSPPGALEAEVETGDPGEEGPECRSLIGHGTFLSRT